MDPNTSTEQGIVAFLDILGYSSFLENNEPEEAAKIVLQVQETAPARAKEAVKKLFERQNMRLPLAHFKWLVFSDSVILACPFKREMPATVKLIYWFLYFYTLIALYETLFDDGLPLRGGLCYGKYFIHKHCFVGKPLIEAYKLSNSLDLAAIAVPDAAIQELASIEVGKPPGLKKLPFLNYLVPLKNKSAQTMNLLSPRFFDPPTDSDVGQAVAESFRKHRKDLTQEAVAKMENTELFWRFAKMNSPHLFK